MTTKIRPLWAIMGKWFTYDTQEGDPSNVVICPDCAPTFERDPSARPLENQAPDPNLKCASCDKVWE